MKNLILGTLIAGILASTASAQVSVENPFPPVDTSGDAVCLLSSNCVISGTWTAPTNTIQSDQTTQLATDQFVWGAIAQRAATVPFSGLTGGTVSFATQGTSFPVLNVTASGGTVTGFIIFYGGLGFAVGDVILAKGGNSDCYLLVTSVGSGGAVTGLSILYGGSNYTTTTGLATTANFILATNYTFAGTLTSNLTLIGTVGSLSTRSGTAFAANNTTGAFTFTVCTAGVGVDACSGGATVTLPQGSSNSSYTQIYLDGVGNVYYATPFIASTGPAPVLTGSCATNTQVGGQIAGSFKYNGACVAGTVVMTFLTTAPNGWGCGKFQDMTTPSDTLNQTGYTTNSITVTGTAASGDQVVFSGCQPF